MFATKFYRERKKIKNLLGYQFSALRSIYRKRQNGRPGTTFKVRSRSPPGIFAKFPPPSSPPSSPQDPKFWSILENLITTSYNVNWINLFNLFWKMKYFVNALFNVVLFSKGSVIRISVSYKSNPFPFPLLFPSIFPRI